MLAPVAPVFHKYNDAPLAESVVLCPGHMAAGEAEAVTEGRGVTVTLTLALEEQPAVVVPVTEYVVEVVGLTVTGVPVAPVFHK